MLDLRLEHDDEELTAILTLLKVKGLGPVKFRSIYEHFTRSREFLTCQVMS